MRVYIFNLVRARHTLLFVVLVLSIVSFLYLNSLTVNRLLITQHNVQLRHVHTRVHSECPQRRNFVFIKQMKCATSTLLGTFYRFGYKRNLSFVSPVGKRIYLNWPYPMTRLDFRPSSSGYNILTDHSIYTEDVMESIMPRNTTYFTIIRHPYAHVMSVFQYFKLGKIANLPTNVANRFEEYLSHINEYDAKYKQANGRTRICIPGNFSMTKNLMSHCLGMPLGFPPGTPDISANPGRVDEYIRHVDEKFGLVMIVEYFFESLVLLRRLMCWSFNDILFIKVNVGTYSFDKRNVSERLRDVHRSWNSVDYKLYEYFNKTFWRKVSEQSNDFFEEVSAFKEIQEKTEKYCRYIYGMGYRAVYRYPDVAVKLTIDATNWSEEFVVIPDDCWMLGPDPYLMMRAVQNENIYKEFVLLKQLSQMKDDRKFKGLC